MEIDEFINSNFTTIEDLSNLHEKLDQLHKLNSKITHLAQDKLVNDQPLVVFDEEKLEISIDKIVSVVDVIKDDEEQLDVSIDNVDSLILEFGNVDLFVELKGILENKKSVVEQVEMLTQAKEIEAKFESKLSLVELGDVSEEIRQFKSCGNDEISSLLGQQLQQQIQTRRDNLQPQLQKVLDECHWLTKEDNKFPDSSLSQISNLFSELIQLQNIANPPTYPNTWWGLEILLHPIIVRFNYHFNTSNKDTNKLSKPEWSFNYIETFLTNYLPLLSLIIDDVFKQVGRIGTYEVITCLLDPIRSKVLRMLQIINSNIVKYEKDPDMLEKNGRLLSHLIFELSLFDQRLRNTYKYNPNIDLTSETNWSGLTSDVLLPDNIAVENWINFENQLANKRFEITPETFHIDFDYQDEDQARFILKPTYSAYSLVKLINNLNNHMTTLTIVKYQLKYVSKIQMSLIDKYYDVLSKNYKVFLDKFNLKTMLQYIPGGMKDPIEETTRFDSLQKGLIKLTEIFCSAKFIVNSLEQWEDEVVFIQLWSTYKSLTNDEEHTSIFSSSISQYDQLVNKVLHDYHEFFQSETKELLKNYVNKSQWVIDESRPTSNLLTPLVNNLPQYLDILKRSISSLDYFNITDRIVTNLSNIIFEYVLTNNRFNKNGINQLVTDFSYIIKSLHVDLFLNNEGEFSNDDNEKYVKLVQAIDLLDSMEPSKAKLYANENTVVHLREDYEHELSQLTNRELINLLSRII